MPDLAASVAKAYVGDAARKVCGEAIQVHGGFATSAPRHRPR